MEPTNGLLAVGDCLVNGYVQPSRGLPARTFAEWLALALAVPLVRLGRGDAVSAAIVAELHGRSSGAYGFGMLSLGLSDTRRGTLHTLESNVRLAVEALSGRCDRLVALSVPYAATADRTVRRACVDLGVDVIDVELSGRRLLAQDLVHPTARGHLEIADRVADHWGMPMPSAEVRRILAAARRRGIDGRRPPDPASSGSFGTVGPMRRRARLDVQSSSVRPER